MSSFLAAKDESISQEIVATFLVVDVFIKTERERNPLKYLSSNRIDPCQFVDADMALVQI